MRTVRATRPPSTRRCWVRSWQGVRLWKHRSWARASWGDDRLGLIFACCHPALALDVRVALTLRYVAGLTTKEIAAAFLVAEPTLAQRLVRAKRKIKDARHPLRGSQQADRTPPVRAYGRLPGLR